MRHGLTIAAALLAAPAFAAPSPATTTQPAKLMAAAPAKPAAAKPMMSDKSQIEGLERGFIAGWKAKNVNKVMSYYDKGGLFVFDVGTPRDHPSWASYKKDWSDFFAENPDLGELKLTDLAITVSGDTAWSHSVQGPVTATIGGKKTPLTVRVTDVYHKAGGRWLIVQEHVSVPVDFQSGQADFSSKP
jgi:ketosteroid isomerase-like protein